MRLLVLLFSLGLGNLWSQEPYALRLTKKEGLPSISVYNCFEDREGFIWIASDDGITRYDGFSFKTFKSEDQTIFSGSCIQQDITGRIWYQNFDGFSYYLDPLSGQLQSSPLRSSIGYFNFGLTNKHFFSFSKNGLEVRSIRDLKRIKTIAINPEHLQHTSFDEKNFFYIEKEKIIKIDPNLNKSTFDSPFKIKGSILIFVSQKRDLVLVQKYNDENQLFLYNEQFELKSNFDLDSIKLIHHINFIDNLIWISTPNGVYVYDCSGKLKNHYFQDVSISGVLKDRQNNYWFSSNNNGIFIVPNLHVQLYQFQNSVPNRIAVIDENRFLIGTKKGEILLCDKKFAIQKTIVSKPEKGELYFLDYQNEEGIISYTLAGFYQIDLKGKVVFQSPYAVKEIKRIKPNYFAFASSNISGLFRNAEKASLKSHEHDPLYDKRAIDGVTQILNSRARSVAYDPAQNCIYFATNQGLIKFQNKRVKELKIGGQTFFASRLVFHQNTLYALSTRGMLYAVNAQGQFEALNQRLKIPDYSIKNMKRFGDQLVFATSGYVHLVSLNDKKSHTFPINIESYVLNDFALSGDRIILLTNAGIIQTKIDVPSEKKTPPIFKIMAIESDSEVYDTRGFFELQYPENEITVKYAILDYGNPSAELLQYRLNSGPWQNTSKSSRELNFLALQPGHYKIEFKLGASSLGEKISFRVLAPWWKTWWFFAMVLVLSFSLFGAIFWYRMRTLSAKNKLLEENVSLEKNLRKSVMTAVKSQMNPHFFYNALNTIQAFIYTNDKENAGKYLLKFSKLTRQILEMSEKENVSLEEEIQTIRLYLELEQARFDEDFSYEISETNLIHKESIKVPPMLIQPYIENAIKHGLLHKSGAKKLRIEFEEKEDELRVIIEDNGIGRKRSGELNQKRNRDHKSFASDANQKRLEVLNYGRKEKLALYISDLTNEFGQASGTRVELSIPFKNTL